MRTPPAFSILVLGALTLLSACGVTAPPQAVSPESVVTVHNPPAEVSDRQLAAQYGGTLIVRTSSFALIGVSGAPRLSAQSAGGKIKVESNRRVFRIEKKNLAASVPGTGSVQNLEAAASGSIGLWANGSIGLWANGSRNYWANGSVNLWANGAYAGLPQNTDPWRQIGLESAQTAATRLGQGVTVAVLDTGVDLSHPAFAKALSPQNTWRDFVDGDLTPQDEGTLGYGEVGHGSEVAGLALQVAPGARVMPLRVLDRDGTGDVANVAAAVVWAADHGANIVNLSLGAGERIEAISQAVAYANAKGVLVVAAAGNSGLSGADYPAAEFGGSAVNVAVGSVNGGDVKSGFSRFDAALGLMAPGENLFGPAPEGQMAAWSGTSMSAPVVAGALALGLGERPGSQTVLPDLLDTARPLDAAPGNAAYQGALGRGRIDLAAFVQRLR